LGAWDVVVTFAAVTISSRAPCYWNVNYNRRGKKKAV
jgi:hypothetical protein